MKKCVNLLLGCAAVLFLFLICQGCQPSTGPRPTVSFQEQTPQPTVPTPTFRPTYTPTPAPIGDPANPLIMGFIAEMSTIEQETAINNLAASLSRTLNLQVNAAIFNSFTSMEEEMREGRVHLAWLDPIEYIIASRSNAYKAVLVTNHIGVTGYGVQFFAHKDSLFRSYFDILKDQSTSSHITALAQFSGTRPCLVDDSSLSGYWVPLGYLKYASAVTSEPALTGSTTASIRALYVKGICDFTATYAHFGDPRTASAITNDLPDIMQQVIIIWRSEKIIPNLNLSVSNMLDLPLQKQLQQTMLDLSRTPEGLQILTDANAYEIAALEIIEDSAYDELRLLLDIQNINIRILLDT